MSDNRPLPNALETELALLSAALIEPARTMLEAGQMPVAAFYAPAHAKVWSAILACYNAGVAIGLQTIPEYAPAADLDEVTSTLNKVLLIRESGLASQAGEYVKILLERWHRRRLIEAGYRLQSRAYESDVDPEEAATEAMHLLTHLDLHAKGPAHISAYMDAVQERINKAILDPAETTGLDTGLQQLNLYTHGLTAPDLWILAARPSLGKTSLATTIGINVARVGKKVLIFSLEQSGCALTQRMIAGAAHVNMRKLRYLPDDKTKDISHAIHTIGKLPIWVDDRGGLTVTQIRSDARRVKAVHGLDLVIVDYIGITRPTHPRMERYEHLTEVSGELKNMAKELNVPVLALSQLNRSLARENRRPRVDDLRESGALEQDADLILLLSANVKADDLPDVWRDKITDANQLENVVLCDVAKNREGGTGHAFLQFNRQFTLYTDLALVK